MTLSVLWFILIAVLWIGYLTLEGFGFGVGMIYKFVAKDERERRALLGTIGPHWDGNEVWLLTAGGATFAAFPEWYGTLFSGAYLVLFLILLALIVRVCAIEWRGKINSDTWRARWDWAHTISAWLPAILWGAAFANLVQGMQIEVVEVASRKVVPVAEALAAQKAGTLIPGASHEITGGFWSLITPFTLLGGLVTCSLFLTHGALFAALKTAGDLSKRCSALALKLGVGSTVLTALWALWAQLAYSASPASWIGLVLAALFLVASLYLNLRGRQGLAFATHFGAIAFAVVFIFLAITPDIMRSAINPAYSLTISQGASADVTLLIMSIAAVVFVPVVLVYTIWSYKVFAKRINAEKIDPNAGLDPVKVRDNSAKPVGLAY
ncbi:cytochrome d ubiquinol oxidase, subunit II [Actinomyces graevenitzii F0530]|uniref:Cytochrome d ubiquinol oxidase, subunit II n=1 Tax=Actinomyces graevenitzii F0530 TaxID=1321817 RepID=U1PX95_9ACTO|nr:cytochrome d ubiquinol oxidase subunit II [Actinomyces graevenitzii]ERH14709.1 cytochrome d ubiquinol oxidase, subunit II [Actinomyces graevenitzii F0530]